MTDGSNNDWQRALIGWQKGLLALSPLLVAGLIGALPSGPDEEPSTRSWLPATENVAFDLPTTTGSRITSAVDGRPTIVWFWAPWCPYSQDIADEVAAEAKISGDKVQFVGIGSEDSTRSMKRFIRNYDVAGIEHGVDVSGDVADRFGVPGFPSFVVLYPEGTYEVAGWVDTAEGLHQLVEEAVA